MNDTQRTELFAVAYKLPLIFFSCKSVAYQDCSQGKEGESEQNFVFFFFALICTYTRRYQKEVQNIISKMGLFFIY